MPGIKGDVGRNGPDGLPGDPGVAGRTGPPGPPVSNAHFIGCIILCMYMCTGTLLQCAKDSVDILVTARKDG